MTPTGAEREQVAARVRALRSKTLKVVFKNGDIRYYDCRPLLKEEPFTALQNDKGYWSQIVGYIQAHSEATFTHGLCPVCMKKYFPETTGLEDQKRSNQAGAGKRAYG